MTFKEIGQALGLQDLEESSIPILYDAPRKESIARIVWKVLAGKTRKPSRDKNASIRHPSVRYLHRLIVHTMFPRKEPGAVNDEELQLLHQTIQHYAHPSQLPFVDTDFYKNFGMVGFFVKHLVHYKEWASTTSDSEPQHQITIDSWAHHEGSLETPIINLTDERYKSNKDHLETVIDWIQSMRIFRLKDFPSFIRTTDRDDIMLNFSIREVERFKGATAIILNTFDDLEHDVIQSIKSMLPLVYSIGPLNLLASQEFYVDSDMRQIGLNLRREETKCLDWLDTKAPNSVVFLDEFAWGLAGSGKEFLWVIRLDLVAGEGAAVPPEFWCPQEKVVYHPAIGGFLTHCGWNSTLESLCDGVPMICWPFFAEQPTNCKFCCDEWGVGMEIGGDVKREEVEAVIQELMDGEKGKKLKEKGGKWQRLAKEATEYPSGSSNVSFETLVNKVL
uniref:Glycosyltransferase n=1 Tax=Brassica oleracea var. oleracea TaxID=109376 RepID=A0A0D3CCE8_BRAOL